MNNFDNNSISTSTNLHSMISIDSVLQDVFRIVQQNVDIMGIDDIRESASFAATHLYTYKFYETALCVVPVMNHKAVIPNYYSIESVWFNENLDKNLYTDNIIIKDVILNQDGVGQLTPKSIFSVKNTLNKFMWVPANLGHSVAGMMGIRDSFNKINSAISSSQVSDNPYLDSLQGEYKESNISDCCNVTFSVSNCILTLNKQEGYVAVIYKRLCRDEEGSLLIPNVPIVLEAIRAYVMWEISEAESFLHREGSESKAEKWLNRWEKLSTAASGKLMMPNLPEWVSTIKTNRMITNDTYDRHYDYNWGNESFNFGFY